MDISVIIAGIVVIAVILVSLLSLRNFKFTTKKITRIGVISALSIILYMIKIVPFPQGGGCSLLHIVPIMLLSILCGVNEGVICAIIVASLKLIIAKPMFIMQIPLDYYGAMLSVALAGVFGNKNNKKVLLGCITAALLSTFCSVLSGVIFFGQYAPEGMNTWVYSMLYNFGGYGVEAAISTALIMFLPLPLIYKNLKLEEKITV